VLGHGQAQVVVGRHADVHKVFSDTQTFASEMPRGPGWEQFNKIMDAQFVTQMDGEAACPRSPPAGSRLVAPAETRQEFFGGGIDPAEGLLLEIPAQGTDQQVLVQGPGQGPAQGGAPQGAKLVEAERADALDLGLDRLAIGRSQGHHRH